MIETTFIEEKLIEFIFGLVLLLIGYLLTKNVVSSYQQHKENKEIRGNLLEYLVKAYDSFTALSFKWSELILIKEIKDPNFEVYWLLMDFKSKYYILEGLLSIQLELTEEDKKTLINISTKTAESSKFATYYRTKSDDYNDEERINLAAETLNELNKIRDMILNSNISKRSKMNR